MTATNHILTGTFIAYSISNPYIGLPIAFLSHIILDMTPHFGNHPSMPFRSKKFRNFQIADGLVSIFIALLIVLFNPANMGYLILAGFVAYSPDLMWVPYYINAIRGKKTIPGRMLQFHKKIQWAERPWGIYIEALWAGVFFGFLLIALYQ